ncbi:MAG: translation elongation factor Ts [Lachnospiraceae bacterium]|nr:translation elongation factor Ts [Lachnospiraceae bacterium]
MAAITAGLVKELREMTGAGMMDCKKALTATDGDMDKAVEFLREKGLAASAKKAGRIAAEGVASMLISEDGKKGVIVEVNSETDFVAKNQVFQDYVAQVAAQAINSANQDNIDAFLEETWTAEPQYTVAQALSQKVAVIGENLKIRRFKIVEANDGVVVSYSHGGGKIGVLVSAKTTVVNDAVKEALKNVAMQIAALSPKYVDRSEVDADFINHEKEILKAQIANDPKEASKPEKVIEGIIMGRINKEMKEICLVDQTYVKAEDGKQSVGAYLKEVSKAVGADVAVKSFVRFETGEGLEKKNEDFAAEVAAQMNK